MIEVRALEPGDMGWVRRFMTDQMGSARVVSRGVLYQADELPGFVALQAGERIGLLTHALKGNQLEVVALYAVRSGTGIGSALLDAARREARDQGCTRLWLITTNDNEPAIRFYRARGMKLVAVHRGAVNESRRIKPEIPERGIGGTPIEDELEFELEISS